MRTIAYMVALMCVGIIISSSTAVFVVLLLTGEKAGFQQAAATLDTASVADYLTTHYTSYCDGTLAEDNYNINPFYMVSMYDFDGNGEYDYIQRINEVNDGAFNIYAGGVSFMLNDPEHEELSTVTQSITYNVSSTRCDWSDHVSGIHSLRYNAFLALRNFMSAAAQQIMDLLDRALDWINMVFTTSGETGDLDVVLSIPAVPTVPFALTPAVTKSAEIHYTIPVIITEGDTTVSDATAAELHVVEVSSRVTFYDVRSYLNNVTEQWS